MLKLFFWLLLIANGVLFAVNRGYLGATASERHEPKRMAQQLQPETLTILPPNSEKLVTPARAAEQAAAAAEADKRAKRISRPRRNLLPKEKRSLAPRSAISIPWRPVNLKRS